MKTENTGVGLFTVIAIVFVILKLTKTIDWSWWWVLAPIWGPLGFFLLFFLIIAIIGGTISLFATKKRRKYK